MPRDTIYAVSSGAPPAGIALIRISGPRAASVTQAFLRSDKPLTPRHMTLAGLYDPASGRLLDRAMLVYFPGPHSSTGEDVVEWHCHGGVAIVEAVCAALSAQDGLREAVGGEFTRRALENGRIDLNEAEGLADLLQAQTENQRRAALSMAEGHFSRKVELWRRELLALCAQVEALLDYAEEEDVSEASSSIQALRIQLSALSDPLCKELLAPSAERLHEGVRVVIAGPPNAGKSTLLNRLVGREAAIVTDIAGTTRDKIEVPVRLGGQAFLFTDTAGLREDTPDQVEAMGIERARAAMDQADLILWLGDGAHKPDTEHDTQLWTIAAQSDRHGADPARDISLSALTGEGMDELIARLIRFGQTLIQSETGYALHKRQRDALHLIADHLTAAGASDDLLIWGEELRLARMALDRLSGRAGVDDMLDSLFSRFCIGK